MTPIFYERAGDVNVFMDTYVKAVLYVWAAAAVIALAFVLLAGIHAAWLQAVTWCNAALDPVVCGMYLAGI